MKRLGFSLYPEKSDYDQDIRYIDKALSLGYSRVFMNMLSISEGHKEETLDRYRKTLAYIKQINSDCEVLLDINPMVMKALEISPKSIEFFKELGVDGLRLDMGFSGAEEAKMTHNPWGLKIEINMSMLNHSLERILDYHPNTDKLVGCHNFYPQAYTGLDLEYFIDCSLKFKRHGIHSAAFVTSQSGQIGPWALQEGLCTLEDHRRLAIETQVKHLRMLDCVDDIIIGNAYASDEELEKAAEAFHADIYRLKVKLDDKISDIEKTIVLNPGAQAAAVLNAMRKKYGDALDSLAAAIALDTHSYRSDYSSYVIRSSGTRFIYGQAALPYNQIIRDIKRGDILIMNDDYGQYKGELQIALKDRPHDPRINVVGRIVQDDMILLDCLMPGEKFELII